MKALTQQRGVSLIEALLALVLISIGMLGYALFLLNSAAANREALYRSQAVIQIQSMAERIQSNLSAVDAYDGLSTSNTDSLDGCDSDCTSRQLAEQHVIDWANAITSVLHLPRPEGQLSVTDEGDVLTVVIELAWQAARDEEPQSVSLSLSVPEK